MGEIGTVPLSKIKMSERMEVRMILIMIAIRDNVIMIINKNDWWETSLNRNMCEIF